MHPAPHPLHILVVEDEPDIREMLVACLSQEAQVERVDGAADGQEALELLARGSMPSVILLDLRMPRLSGEGLLRALDALPHPPVVTMSACTHQPPRGSAAHLDKPFTIEDAMSVLRRVCCQAELASRQAAELRPGMPPDSPTAPRPPVGSAFARAPTPPPR